MEELTPKPVVPEAVREKLDDFELCVGMGCNELPEARLALEEAIAAELDDLRAFVVEAYAVRDAADDRYHATAAELETLRTENARLKEDHRSAFYTMPKEVNE